MAVRELTRALGSKVNASGDVEAFGGCACVAFKTREKHRSFSILHEAEGLVRSSMKQCICSLGR